MPKMAICLTLKASERLRGWLIVSHLLPLLPAAWLLPVTLLLPFSVFCLVLFFYHDKRYCRSGLCRVQLLPADQDSGFPVASVTGPAPLSDVPLWQLEFSDGSSCRAVLAETHGLSPFWQHLLFIDRRRRRYPLLVMADSCPAEEFRRLRLWLSLRRF